MSRKEAPASSQFALDFSDFPPLRISSATVSDPELIFGLRQDKLWPKRRSHGMLIDLINHQQLAFDLKSFDILPAEKSNTRKRAVVIISKPLSPDTNHEPLIEAISTLSKNGIFYLIEEKEGQTVTKFDSEWRKELMAELGLVNRDILTAQRKDYIWRGKTPAEHPHHAINLIESYRRSDQYWKRDYLHRLAVDVRKRLHAQGYKVVSWQEILAELSASHNVKWSIDSLKMGCGIEIERFCGCRWHIDLDGVEKRLKKCEPNCDGKPPARETIPSQENPPLKCNDCGTELVKEQRLIKQIGRKEYYIVDLSCPHHGLVSSQEISVYN